MTKGKEPFELIEHLGTGGFAQTWRARVIDQDLIEEWGEEVALKIPLNKKKERMLRKELELNGSLHMQLTEVESKNIVKYLGFEIFDEKLVMVMEYVKGGSLRNLLGNIGRQKRVEIKDAISIAEGILEGLSVIHKHHILHRDIKPENILLSGRTPKISDLGIGRMLKTNELASTTTGTLFYMAPELLFEEGGASFNADTWSFGITFFEMLSGQLPFGLNEKMPPGKVMNHIRDDNIKLLFPTETTIPLKIQNIVSKVLIREPALRYKSVDDILKDLRKFNRRSDDSIEREVSSIRQMLQDPSQTSVAEEQLKKIAEKYPDEPKIYVYLGEFYNKCENHEKAIEMFQEGIEKDPGEALFYWGIAFAYQKTGEFNSAIAALKKALDIGLEKSQERYAKALLESLHKRI